MIKVKYIHFGEIEHRLLENALSVIKAVESFSLDSVADTKYPCVRYGTNTSLDLILSANEPDESAQILEDEIAALPLVWYCDKSRYANTGNWFYSVNFKSSWLKSVNFFQ